MGTSKKTEKKKGNKKSEVKTSSQIHKEQEEKEIKKYHKRMFWLKLSEYLSAAVLLLCIFIPLTVVVICQIDSDLQDYKEAAALISTFTSIILGFVAMTVSLIGMVLSFHNTRQAEDSNLSTTKEFTKLANAITNLKELEERLDSNLEKISEKINALDKQMLSVENLQNQISLMQRDLSKLSSDVRLIADRTCKDTDEKVSKVKATPKPPDDDNYDG